MPTALFPDPAKCEQRNRICARKGQEAVPLAFLVGSPSIIANEAGDRLISARGSLPRTDDEALSRINAIRAQVDPTADPLTLDDVYIHYVEAANSNFIWDRYAFMDTSTLRNIATDAEAGAAFMNSHRTGGYSEPSELPYGRTFAGRYEHLLEAGRDRERALIGLYMLRGTHPNGANGPSTDDLHSSILGGTLFDVSVGLGPDPSAFARCDVCGNDLNAYNRETYAYDCPHIPGTHHRMTEEEQAAQKERGVANGAASYSLVGYRLGEVSGVYDGAVPGAGVKKALTFSRSARLGGNTLAEARQAYSTLTQKGDFQMDEIVNAIKDGFAGLKAQFVKSGEPADSPPPPAPVPPSIDLAVELEAERAEKERLAAEIEALKQAQAEAELARMEAERLEAEQREAEAVAALESKIKAALTTRNSLGREVVPTPASVQKGVEILAKTNEETRAELLEWLPTVGAVELGARGFVSPGKDATDGVRLTATDEERKRHAEEAASNF